jgi:group I intron endonuclease
MFMIYKYTSPSGKYYIGQTCKTQAGRAGCDGYGYQNCPLFWRAIQKYGWKNFEYEVLEDGLTAEEANEKEQYYISYYQSNNPEYGYNIRGGGNEGGDYEYSKRLETIKQLWDEGKTTGEIAKELNLEAKTITYDMSRAGIDGKERIKRSAGQYLAKTVYQYSLDLQLIAIYGSTAEAERATGIYNIRRSCAQNETLSRPKYKSGGFYWTYQPYPGEKIF